MEPRISLITLGVSDLPRATRFYEEGLGLPRSSDGGDAISFFRTNGVVLALFPREALAEDANLPAAGSGFCGITLAHNVTSTEQVDAILAAAVAAGATLIKPAAPAKHYEGYNGYFADLDGYPWEIAYVPGIPFAPDGSLALPE